MVKRSVSMQDNDPEQSKFEIPSQKEHLFQVVDIFTDNDEIGDKLGLDNNTLSCKCEVVGGSEEGRGLLVRVSLDPTWKGFFFTRLFLKAIGEPCRGEVEIDSDRWIGRQFFATVKHDETGKYANIDEYNFDKCAGLSRDIVINPGGVNSPEQVNWDE